MQILRRLDHGVGVSHAPHPGLGIPQSQLCNKPLSLELFIYLQGKRLPRSRLSNATDNGTRRRKKNIADFLELSVRFVMNFPNKLYTQLG
jgi:hypothetical protein